MRTQRTKAWFHRIGIVGAVICGIPATLILIGALYLLITSENVGDAGAAAAMGAAWATR